MLGDDQELESSRCQSHEAEKLVSCARVIAAPVDGEDGYQHGRLATEVNIDHL